MSEQAMAKKKSENKRWVREVTTVSTFPPEGIFTKDAQTIANVMAREDVSPKGIGSGIRMVQYFINRAGKGLPAQRKQALEEAKEIMRERMRNEKSNDTQKKEKTTKHKKSAKK
jgi:tRNA(adenine34) deaminase